MNFSLDRSLREECGVVGVFGNPKAAELAHLGLFAQQHRGQEGCGIVSIDRNLPVDVDEGQFHAYKSFGLVAETFTPEILANLTGDAAVGHVRYSTQGGHIIQNVQPFYFRTSLGPLAIAHNGNLTNAREIRANLEASGSILQSTSDSEVFVHLITRSAKPDLRERIYDVMGKVHGAYSMVLLSSDRLFAVRDPYGFRPLVLGRRGETNIVASETCALDLLDAEFVREIEPGEVVEISANGMTSHFPLTRRRSSFCSFEPIYFARPDSRVFGEVVYRVRRRMGAILAAEAPAMDAEIVIAVPDSGVPMAMGYAEVSGLSLELGLVRNHYVGRTFIQPAQEIRDFGVKLKLNPVVSVLEGKSVVVVDDSIVRGTTSAKIIRMVREAGARRVHVRIGSPPITHSCFYGVDTPERARLLAAQKNVDEIKNLLGCDSLAYLSREGLRKALDDEGDGRYCYACFSGEYPEKIFSGVPHQPTDGKGPGYVAGKGW